MDKEKQAKHPFQKWIWAICAVVVLVVVSLLVSWLPWNGRTFSEGTVINGVDVSDLTIDEAYEQLTAAAEDYTLTVNFEDGQRTMTGEELGLTVGKKSLVRKALKQQYKGQSSDGSNLQSFLLEGLYDLDTDGLSKTVEDWQELTTYQNQEAKDAKLVYQKEKGVFEIEPEQPGGTIDPADLAAQMEACAMVLNPELDALEDGLYGDIRSAQQPELQEALKKANAQLNLNITYEYHVENESGQVIHGTETIGRDLLSQWLYVEEDGCTVDLEADALQNYVTLMHDTYSVQGGSTSKFVTTNGDYVEVNVPAADETVDTDALYQDIVSAVDNLESGTREAPYASTSVGVSGTTDLGGNYIEIDLDSQHLWLYRDSTMIADGDICSGDVATGCATPGGLYTINSMETDRWLNGPTWHDWVSYWMPFNGSIGLHDATWRSEEEFGGDVYLENGSHGCINMPLELATKVYENVDVGFYVILYGGEESDQNQPQTITGTGHYDKETGDEPFYLDAQATGDGGLTYSSSDENVVQVNDEGLVTVVGGGQATITVVAPATQRYIEATKEITITVTGPEKTEPQEEPEKPEEETEKPSTGSQKPSSNNNQSNQGESQKDESQKEETSKPTPPEEEPEKEDTPDQEETPDSSEEEPEPVEPAPQPEEGDSSVGTGDNTENAQRSENPGGDSSLS